MPKKSESAERPEGQEPAESLVSSETPEGVIDDENAIDLPEALQAKDFFLARQPILDRDQNLVGYELLFRSAASGPANVSDDVAATAAVIAHAAELGINNVIGNMPGYVNVDAAVLYSDFIKFLPSDRVVLEILETVKVTPELVARVAELSQAGFTFALDDVVADSPDIQQLLPLIRIIKIDVMAVDPSKLLVLSVHFKRAGKLLLAEKVETIEQYKECLAFGFDYFQGYYFAKPMIMRGKKLDSSKVVIMQILALLVNDSDNREIVAFIKKDVGLSLTLLRLVNTPVYGFMRQIDSLGQALFALGRRQLKRWLQILLYASTQKGVHALSPLVLLAATRGKMLELLAEKLMPGRRKAAETAFTVGIMSLVDALFGLTMDQVLKETKVSEEIRHALVEREGFYGDLLKLAECSERMDKSGAEMQAMLKHLKLTVDELYELQMSAFEWTNAISTNMGN
jgi:EAL and modified HD-GYP domain-containing signal transduction protein